MEDGKQGVCSRSAQLILSESASAGSNCTLTDQHALVIKVCPDPLEQNAVGATRTPERSLPDPTRTECSRSNSHTPAKSARIHSHRMQPEQLAHASEDCPDPLVTHAA